MSCEPCWKAEQIRALELAVGKQTLISETAAEIMEKMAETMKVLNNNIMSLSVRVRELEAKQGGA